MLNIYKEYITTNDKKNWAWENFLNFKSLKKVEEVRQQLVEYTQELRAKYFELKKNNEKSEDDLEKMQSQSIGEKVNRCVASAFFRHVAILQPNGHYRSLIDNKETFIHPSSVLSGFKPKAVIFTELVCFFFLIKFFFSIIN